MAKETTTRLVDDLDGGVAHETVTFGLDGHTYEIDLSTKNARKMRGELGPFVANATRLGKLGQPTTRRALRSDGRNSTEHNRAVREWAISKGYEVSPRGRIKAEIVDAFDQSHP